MQVDDGHDIDVVMPMYNVIEYSDNYSKTSGILRQYCRAEPALDDNGAIVDFFFQLMPLLIHLKLKKK